MKPLRRFLPNIKLFALSLFVVLIIAAIMIDESFIGFTARLLSVSYTVVQLFAVLAVVIREPHGRVSSETLD